MIIDAPPGTSCPFIASVKGSDFCILVTEPTPFGLSDLKLTVEVCKKLGVPFGVVINRHNIGDSQVEEYCSSEKIPILMKIPFSRKIAARYSAGLPFVDTIPEFKEKFNILHTTLMSREYEKNYSY